MQTIYKKISKNKKKIISRFVTYKKYEELLTSEQHGIIDMIYIYTNQP